MLKKLILTTLALLTIFVLFACSLPQPPNGKGSLVITLPGVSNATARAIKLPDENRDYYINNMSYTLTFTGPGGMQERTADAGRTVTIYLEPGTWKIDVEAVFMHRSDDDIDGRPKPLKAGKGSETVTIIAGQQNRINIPIEVLPELAVYPSEFVQRFWSKSSVIPEIHAMVEYNFGNAIEHQWYYYDRGKEDEKHELDTSVVIQPDVANLTTVRYYFCKITYEFDSTDGGKEERFVFTTPAVVYPDVTSEYLQEWIADENSNEIISLPLGNYYLDKLIKVERNITLYAEYSNGYGSTELKRGALNTEQLFLVDGVALNLGEDMLLNVTSSLILDGDRYDNNTPALSLIRVENGGKLEIGYKVTLCNNNSSGYGGGVHVNNGTFTMKGDSEVHGNTASTGGGVHIAENSFFIIEDEALVHNNSSASNGGGVHIDESNLTLKGKALIQNNTADTGSGVYVRNGGTINISEEARVDNIVYLNTGCIINIEGNLTDVTATLATIQPNTYTVRKVLGGDPNLVAENYEKFAVRPNGNVEWSINNEGWLMLAQGGRSGIFIDFAKIVDGAPELEDGSIVIHRSSANGNTTRTLTVDNSAEYTVIQWYFGNILLSDQSSLTLNSIDTRYNVIGQQLLTLEVEKDGVLYSRTITFEVKQ